MLLAVKRPRRRTGRNGAGRCNFSSVLSVTAWDLGIYGDSLTCANRTEEVRIHIYIYSRLSINLSLASLSPLLHKKTNKQIDKDRPKAKNLNGISNFEFKQLDYSCENVFLQRWILKLLESNGHVYAIFGHTVRPTFSLPPSRLRMPNRLKIYIYISSKCSSPSFEIPRRYITHVSRARVCWTESPPPSPSPRYYSLYRGKSE